MLSPTQLTHLADSLGGLPILGCSYGSPAARAGLRYGDIVLSLEDMPTPSWAAFLDFAAARARGGGRVRMRVFRRGATLELEMSLPLSRAVCSPRAVLDAPAQANIVPQDWS